MIVKFLRKLLDRKDKNKHYPAWLKPFIREVIGKDDLNQCIAHISKILVNKPVGYKVYCFVNGKEVCITRTKNYDIEVKEV